jgi:ribosomal protein L7/L12
MTDNNREIAEIKARLETIETQLRFLFRRLGITTREAPAGRASAAVLDLAARGDRIAAIRAFREETGASLKDAKKFVESLGIEIKS